MFPPGEPLPGQPDLDDPHVQALRPEGFELKSIEGKAGDLLIWHRHLPHGSGVNRSARPRIMQLISMTPVPPERGVNSGYFKGDDGVSRIEQHVQLRSELAERRVAMWREQLHVASFDNAWDPARPYETTGFGGERKLKPGPPAQLTPLGKRLLGLEPW